jgi:nitric oxide reductase subunit C
MRVRWHFIYFFLSISFLLFSWKVYTDTEIPVLTLSEEAANGKKLWQKHNCISCHQLYGLGGFMGPDLTNVMSDPAKGELYVSAILKHGMNRMPDYKFTDEEINALMEFFIHTDQSGIYPLRNFTINLNGTVSDPVR